MEDGDDECGRDDVVWVEPDRDDAPGEARTPSDPAWLIIARRQVRYSCVRCDAGLALMVVTAGEPGYWTFIRFDCPCGARWGQAIGALGELVWDDDWRGYGGGTSVGVE